MGLVMKALKYSCPGYALARVQLWSGIITLDLQNTPNLVKLGLLAWLSECNQFFLEDVFFSS